VPARDAPLIRTGRIALWNGKYHLSNHCRSPSAEGQMLLLRLQVSMMKSGTWVDNVAKREFPRTFRPRARLNPHPSKRVSQ